MSGVLEKQNFDKNILIPCVYGDQCSGCDLLKTPYGHQAEVKKTQLFELFKEFSIHQAEPTQFLSAGPAQLRDRLDFGLEEGRLGLYQKTRHEILDLEICAQLSPALQDWLKDFRKIQWPFKKGSIRLRVGPQGQRGVWLDFSNLDIKHLLDEKNILHELLKVSFVEIGQRRKVPVWTGEEYKLRDPQLRAWFQTWMNDRPVDLYCQVASFTQPSLIANKVICDVINSWVQSFPQAHLIEFGSGIGNLTLPSLAASQSLVACEIDELSLLGLQRTLENLPPDLQAHRSKISIHRGDFQKKLTSDFSRFDGVLANPPRSGLMNFLSPLTQLTLEQRPSFFIYMSCFPESLVKDLQRLQGFGYEVKSTYIIDQFPQTKHYEVLTLLQRKKP